MTVWPLDDKDYTAESIGAFAGTRTRGVYSAEDCFRVTADGGFRLKLSPGLAWLKKAQFWGVAILENSESTFTVEVGSGQLSRWVAVCIVLDKTANDARAELRYGEYSDVPRKPVPRRDAYHDEIIVATVLQAAAQVEITASDIHDERMDESMCGLMRDGVTGLPTQALFDQFAAESGALLRAIQDELSVMVGGTGFDPAPLRVQNLRINAGLFRTYTADGEEETALYAMGYQYRASVPVSGVIGSMTPYITMSLPSVDRSEAGYANQFRCYNGGFYVYSDAVPAHHITALTAEFRKAVS